MTIQAASTQPAASVSDVSLRSLIARLEQRSVRLVADGQRADWTTGAPMIDHALAGGLTPGAVHELAPVTWPDLPVAAAFALALLARLPASGEVVCVLDPQSVQALGRPYGLGLARLGLPVSRMLFVAPRRADAALWALEEAVRAAGVAGVLGFGVTADFTQSRRLSLAAAQTAVPCLLVPPHPAASLSAATRWRIGAAASAADGFDARAPGSWRWQVELVRLRDSWREGGPRRWLVEWNDASGGFDLVTPFGDRARRPWTRVASSSDRTAFRRAQAGGG